jgi:hypothetical protein
MKQRLNELLKILQDFCKENNLKVDDNTLFSETISTYRGEQVGKNRFNNNLSNLSGSKSNFSEKEVDGAKNQRDEKPQQSSQKKPATKKQLYYIHQNNLDVNTENLTLEEAKAIIKEHKEDLL